MNRREVLSALLLSVVIACHTAFPQSPGAAPARVPDFALVALPDTQYYTDEVRGAKFEMFTAQTGWVARNKTRQNIKAVIGLGDIVDHGEATVEWQRADAAYRILDRAAVPYALTLGNHDYDHLGITDNRAATRYNACFGPARFASYSWYGGGYPAGSNENFYITFPAGAGSFLVLALEYYPRTAALEWAQTVLDANPDKQVIIATHAYLDRDGKRLVKNHSHGPDADGLTSAANNDAEEMWSKFIKRNRNIILVLSGHICQGISVMARRSDAGEHGNLVHQLLADYQLFTGGGSGYLRIMKFRPSKKSIEVTTYSPYLNTYLTDASNQFTLRYAGATRR